MVANSLHSFVLLCFLFKVVTTGTGSLDVKWTGTETGKVCLMFCSVNFKKLHVILLCDLLPFFLGADRGVPGQGHMARGGMARYQDLGFCLSWLDFVN